FQQIANRILYADPRLRAPAAFLARNTLGPAALWAHRISADLPIVLVRIAELEDREIVPQLLRAHEYWRTRGLAVDLAILSVKPRARPDRVFVDELGRFVETGRDYSIVLDEGDGTPTTWINVSADERVREQVSE